MKSIVGTKPSACVESHFHLLAAVLVFLGSVYAITIALGLFRVSVFQAGAIAVFLASLFVSAGYWYFLAQPVCEPPDGGKRKTHLPGLIRGVTAVAASLYLLLWLTAYLIPDTGFDGLWYHNPTMHFWSLKGYVHWIDGGDGSWSTLINQRFNGWPKGIELLGFVMVRGAGISRLLNAVNLPFLALGVYSIVCLSRLFGASRGMSWLSGCLFIFVPVNIVLSLTTLVDPGVASCYIALMAMTAYAVNRITSGNIPLKIAPALGCALGLSIGAKGPGIVLFPLVILIVMTALAISHRINLVNGKNADHRPRSFSSLRASFSGKGLLFILITVLVMETCGGYWHLRNLIITGSPVYPIGLSVEGRTIFPGEALETLHQRKPYAPGTENWSQPRRVLFSWLDNLSGWRRALTLSDPNSGGMGLLWILGCIPSIFILGGVVIYRVVFFVGRKRALGGIAPPFLSVALITLTLFFFMPAHHNHKIRYILWLYGFGLPCFAVVAGRVWESGSKILRRGGIIWVCLSVAVIVFEGIYCFQHQVKLLCDYYQGEKEGKVSLSRVFFGRYPTDYFWGDLHGSAFDSILGDSRPIALGPIRVMAQPILGHVTQEQAFGKREIYFLDPVIAADPGRVIDYIRQRSIRYVIWDEGMPVPHPLRKMAILDELAGRFFRVLVIDPGENLVPSAQSSEVP